MVKNAAFMPRKVARRDDEVLPKQQCRNRGYAGKSDRPKVKQHHQPHQQPKHDQVHRARSPESRVKPERGGNTQQSCRAIMRLILACIEHIEPRNPEQHRRRKNDNARIERAAYRDPRRLTAQCPAPAPEKDATIA